MPAATETHPARLPILFAFLVTAALTVTASYLPHGRIWGLSIWAYFPSWLPAAVAVILLFWAILARRIGRNSLDLSSTFYLNTALATIALFFASFIFFRTQTHYLGDGYALLDFLASDQPLIKNRNWLESWVRLFVRDLLGGRSAEHALSAFQVVSWAGGALFAILAAVWSRRLIQQPLHATLFMLGLMTGGFVLMFFGYVENYSLFIPCVLWFALSGLGVAKGKNRPWWILLLLVAAVALHIFGITLLPAAVYLILSHDPVAKRLQKLPAVLRWGSLTVVLVVAAALFTYFWSTDQFFRYAFVPIVHDRVTVEGYTMFSVAHLLDIVNLLLILVPGLLVLLVALLIDRPPFRNRDTRFVGLLILSTVGAAFIFDPKLGMPRDWDLFAFCGVPTAVGLYYLVLTYSRAATARMASFAAIGLGVCALAGRVATQQSEEIAAARFEQYSSLDSKKNMNFRKLVVDYYEQSGDMERAAIALKQFHDTYPEWDLNRQGLYYLDQGDVAAAIPLFRAAIDENPVFTAAYSNLAMAYAQASNLDSAETMAEIARGFNPLGPRIATTLGQIALRRNQVDLAEQYFLEAQEHAPDDVSPLIGLAMVARVRGDDTEYASRMVKTLRFDRVPVPPLRGFANFLASHGQYAAAVRVYQKAVDNGMSETDYLSLLSSNPPLKQAADSLAAADSD